MDIEWVTIGDPGNPADTRFHTPGWGAVPYTYEIAKYETTNAQYVEFLNAVAADDPVGLFDSRMQSHALGGITRSGLSGSFTYGVKAGFAEKPVNFVSTYDARRFANWLNNVQPTGAQGEFTTENGAYALTGIAAGGITRNSVALVFLPSEDEWHKAAYYDATTASYFTYPTGTDIPPTCSAPTSATNSANCDAPGADETDPDVDATTVVGSFTGSASPYGTFDQGGNVFEWTERIPPPSFCWGFRGGSWRDGGPEDMVAGNLYCISGTTGEEHFGFRVARKVQGLPSQVPLGDLAPPAVALLLLTTGLLGLAVRQRRHGRS